jgi:hypothetical protein
VNDTKVTLARLCPEAARILNWTTPLRMGDKDTCKTCGEGIEYVGPYWRHTTSTPRHIAIPRYKKKDVNIATENVPALCTVLADALSVLEAVVNSDAIADEALAQENFERATAVLAQARKLVTAGD